MEELFSRIRYVYPSFAKEMEKKISPEDYNLYCEQQKKLKSVLPKNVRTQDKLLADILLEHKDKVSEVIDSEDFSKACKIEDEFLVDELSKYIEKLEHAPEETQEAQCRRDIVCKEEKVSTVELANRVLCDRKNRLKKYEDILSLFDMIKKKKYVRIVEKPENNDIQEINL